MPVSLPSLSAAVVCDGKELETYNVEQESASFSKAFIASEAGKVSVFSPVGTGLLRPGTRGEFLGLYKNVQSILPFKFKELQLVGTFPMILRISVIDVHKRPRRRRCRRLS